MAKQERCCTKYAARLGAAKQQLTRLARLEAYHAQQGHDVSKLKDQIIAQREEVARVKQAITDHEAEHAGEAVAAL